MPIRVITFDPTGTRLRMLDRNGVAQLILWRIHSAYDGGATGGNSSNLLKEYSKYAILSHTWIRGSPGDVVYKDWDSRELPENSYGYAKISNFCKVAASHYGVTFGWMDTVCINKDSSSELDESIRSMYKWYQLAHVCVTYLSETTEIEKMHLDSWFTRGWTLQELLAPATIRFYNRDWHPIVPSATAEKTAFDAGFDDISTWSRADLEKHADEWLPVELQYQIFKATTITRSELALFRYDLKSLPLSRIMQLVAMRKVTREEDKIYSLMGLLQVGIPVAYGEGSEAAFTRLLRKIMALRYSCMDVFNHRSRNSLLPTSITDYLYRSKSFDRTKDGFGTALNAFPLNEPITLTHLGVRVSLLFIPTFRKDIYQTAIPSSSVSHTIWLASGDYLLLKNAESSITMISGLTATPSYPNHGLIYLAVLNFIRTKNQVVLPMKCLCIAMNPRIREPCDITDVDVSKSVPISRPLVLSLDSTTSHWLVSGALSHEQVQKLGMQVATVYMK